MIDDSKKMWSSKRLGSVVRNGRKCSSAAVKPRRMAQHQLHASRGDARIALQQPAESSAAHDFVVGQVVIDERRRASVDQAIAESLMGPLAVVIRECFVEDVLQMGFAEHKKMVQHFFLQRANDPLAMGVQQRL